MSIFSTVRGADPAILAAGGRACLSLAALAAWLLGQPAPLKASPVIGEEAVSIIFTGDLLLDRGVRRVIENHGEDYLFTHSIDSLFHKSDYVVANLECPATQIQSPVFKRFVFRGNPEWLTSLQRHGITHLNLANNHSIDQGRQGLMDTKRQAEAAGLITFGGDSTMQVASQPLRLATRPRNIYLLGSLRMPLENFTYLPQQPSVSMENIDTLLHRITRLREEDPDCYIVVCPHWGIEHRLRPTPDQRRDARRMVDAGADCVIGHHSHTLQTIEEYRGRRIYYSIGNFIFDQSRPLNAQACLVRLVIKKQSATVETLPIVIRNCVPHLRNSEATPAVPTPSLNDT